MTRLLASALAVICLGVSRQAAGQTVYYPDPPPGARADSGRPAADTAPRDTTRPDTSRGAPAPKAAAPAPAPAPQAVPVDPVLSRACGDAAPGESAPDLLGVVFTRTSTVESREEVIAAVEGKRLGGSAEDEFQYVQVPAGGSEFRLRALADKLIRFPGVSEVGPIPCPTQPPAAAPPP